MKTIKRLIVWLRSKFPRHKQLSIMGQYFTDYIINKYINETSDDFIYVYDEILTKYMVQHNLKISKRLASIYLLTNLLYDCVDFEREQVCNKVHDPSAREMIESALATGMTYYYFGGKNENYN